MSRSFISGSERFRPLRFSQNFRQTNLSADRCWSQCLRRRPTKFADSRSTSMRHECRLSFIKSLSSRSRVWKQVPLFVIKKISEIVTHREKKYGEFHTSFHRLLLEHQNEILFDYVRMNKSNFYYILGKYKRKKSKSSQTSEDPAISSPFLRSHKLLLSWTELITFSQSMIKL